ncbi:MAG TPA: hypothetical protein ENI73_03890, partial [Spirochaetes bacterium]|nr:hypothetical protein [Spirochaetota bacterium]
MEDKRGLCVIWTWIILFVVTTLTQEALAGDTIKGEYVYFTQGKNITNLNTQLPAQKGLLEKKEKWVVSIGQYQKITKAPRTRLDINVVIKMEKNVLTLSYTVDPDTMQINHRIPIHQQLFQEAVSETHVYLVFPRKLILSNEIQTIHAIDNTTEKQMSLFASFSEDTKLSELLRKYNAFMEGTYELTGDERTQLERAFDNTASVAGKFGKIATGIKYGIKKQEQKRIRKLQKKYGDNYLVYKMPFFVPEGISMAYSHIGRVSTFFMDASMLDEADKIYVEIPKLSFEMNVSGAIRRASLEGLTYEVNVEPIEPDYTKESLYGEWRLVGVPPDEEKQWVNHIVISENYMKYQLDSWGKKHKDGPVTIVQKDSNTSYEIMGKNERTRGDRVKIVSPNLIFFRDGLFKRVGTKEKETKEKKLLGTWKFVEPGYRTIKLKIGEKDLFMEDNSIHGKKQYRIVKVAKIDDAHIIFTGVKGRTGADTLVVKLKGKDTMIAFLGGDFLQFIRQTEPVLENRVPDHAYGMEQNTNSRIEFRAASEKPGNGLREFKYKDAWGEKKLFIEDVPLLTNTDINYTEVAKRYGGYCFNVQLTDV